MPKFKSGTQLNGVPSDDDMREARRKQRFISVTDSAVDPDIGACRAAIQNIVEGRKLKPRRGRPFDDNALLTGLEALETAKVPLRDWLGSPAHNVMQGLGYSWDGAHALLRRLVDIRTRVTEG